jgi:glycosyltransferase involved in cell wall biosynthesis/peptidoglycan/xylan/chitin deacetylase (PgdA/CDA1 family)
VSARRPPLVSVVTCFLDAERFFEEAIESVFAQSHPAWELILVDDGSRDGSAAIARRYERRHPDRVRVVTHAGGRNLGKSASRNAGIAASNGELLLFLDADDVLLARTLEKLAGAISRSPQAAVAYGRARMWFSWPGNPDGRDAAWDFDTDLPAPEGSVLPAGRLLPALVRDDDDLPSVCSAIVRRAALDAVGGWEDAFVDQYDDFVLWSKLLSRYPVRILDETLSLYRKHADSSCAVATREGEWSAVDLSASRYRYLAWMERHLTRERLGDEATWAALEAALAPYRHPTAPVAVDAVAPAAAGEAGGARGHLDHPRPEGRARSHRLPVTGWAAGNGARALAVELIADGRPIRQVPLDGRRPDVAAQLGRGRDERHGFSTAVELAGTAPLALDVAAVLEDQRRVPLARIDARRLVRPQDVALGALSVSVVIVCRTEAAPLAGAIESALAQDHRPLEVVVVDDGSSSALERIALAYPGVRYVRTEGEGVGAARRAGLRRGGGDLLLLLAPRERLHPRAVSAAVARLAADPQRAFVAGAGERPERPLDRAALLHDGPAAGPLLVRRLALHAAGGIPDAPEGVEDWALQLRLARAGAGIAIADPLLAERPPAKPVPPASVRALLGHERAHAAGARERRALRRAERLIDGRRGGGLARRLQRGRAQGRALILMYHRIAELPADPWGLAVAPERFAEQLAVLREQARPLALHELVTRLERGRPLPARAVAVTFDDGYRDNLDAALPALEAAGVPATLFLATDMVGRGREPWWDELERILLSPGELPARLSLRVAGRTIARNLGESAVYGPAAAYRHARWRGGRDPAPTARHAAYLELWLALWPLAEAPRTAALDQLAAWAGAKGGVRESHRTLDPDGVAALATSDAFEVGGHTISHPRLSARRADAQREEIARGRALVAELTGAPARHFAYPYGGLDDYTPASARLVAQAGYASACATWEGTVHAACDPWQLPRVQVPDVGGEAFAAWLAERSQLR